MIEPQQAVEHDEAAAARGSVRPALQSAERAPRHRGPQESVRQPPARRKDHYPSALTGIAGARRWRSYFLRPSRRKTGSAPMPFISISPRGVKVKRSARKSRTAALTWIAPAGAVDSMRLAVFTVVPQIS